MMSLEHTANICLQMDLRNFVRFYNILTILAWDQSQRMDREDSAGVVCAIVQAVIKN